MFKNKTFLQNYLPPAMAGAAFALTLLVSIRLLTWLVRLQNPELLDGILSLVFGLPILIAILVASFGLGAVLAFVILLKCKTTSKAFIMIFGSLLASLGAVVAYLKLAHLGPFIPELVIIVASVGLFVLIHSLRTIPVLFRSIILITLSVLAIIFIAQSLDPMKDEKARLVEIKKVEYTMLVPPHNTHDSVVWYVKPYGKTYADRVYTDGVQFDLAFDKVMYADTKSLIELKAPVQPPAADCSNGYLLPTDMQADSSTCTLVKEANGFKVYHQQQEAYIPEDNQYSVKHTYFATKDGTLIKTLFSRTTTHDAQKTLITQPDDFTRSGETQQALLTNLIPITDDELLEVLRRSH